MKRGSTVSTPDDGKSFLSAKHAAVSRLWREYDGEAMKAFMETRRSAFSEFRIAINQEEGKLMRNGIGIQVGRFFVVAAFVLSAVLLTGCLSVAKKEITARTDISGVVNGSEMKGKVVAEIDVNRGGKSACEFPVLPEGLTPGTFGTHT